MSFEEAAAIPQAAMLAVQGLQDKGEIKDGQKILINGAGGGVGTFALQLCKIYNVEVTGVDNEAKLEKMNSLGFDFVIDYQKEDFTTLGINKYDLILDTKTNRSIIFSSIKTSRNLCYSGWRYFASSSNFSSRSSSILVHKKENKSTRSKTK